MRNRLTQVQIREPLITEAVLAPSPESKVTITPGDMFRGPEPIFYRRHRRRPISELGASWTYKPEPIK